MPLETDKLVILCHEKLLSSDTCAEKVANFLGADVMMVSVAQVRNAAAIKDVVPSCPALIVHLDTLAALADAFEAREQELLPLTDLSAKIFVYGSGSTERHAAVLKALSSGGLAGLRSLVKSEVFFKISDNDRAVCGAFTGLTFSAAVPASDAVFVDGQRQEGVDVIVRAEGHPFFVRVKQERSELFFVASGELADPDEEASSESGLLPWFSRLVPLMIFLRCAFGERLWHNDTPRACFIIDDPLLKSRYGFLTYSKILEEVGSRKFSMSIAFIPWNYRRSNRDVARMFASAPVFFSLCVHGCDHTRGEFAATGREVLRGKARLALDRMRTHGALHGLPFDEVMVFPQGLFSSEALNALDSCGYLAAVNTTLRPLDESSSTKLRELIDVAVKRFGGVPLFSRHYPRNIAEFAFDLFLGKPALIVEHHGYFRNGYEELGCFVTRINQLDDRLAWSNLGAICSQASLQRITPSGEVQVRFYTKHFHLTNQGTRRQTYIVQTHCSDENRHPNVTLNGCKCVGVLESDVLTISLSLDSGEAAEVRVGTEASGGTSTEVWKPTTGYNARVFIRRLLSEIRDDHVETNRFLWQMLLNVRSLRTKGKLAEDIVSKYAN